MSSEIEATTIVTYQGDTCEITFTGLNDLIGETIGFESRDRKTNEPIFDELKQVVNNEGEVTFIITPKMSNEYKIKSGEIYNIYSYGIKQINLETGEENTILLGDNPKFGEQYLIKVYLKKVEGIKE